MAPEEWQRQHRHKPVRLLLTCRREGYEPWTVLYEILAVLDRKASIRVG